VGADVGEYDGDDVGDADVGETEVGEGVDKKVGTSVGWDVGSFVPIGLIGRHIK